MKNETELNSAVGRTISVLWRFGLRPFLALAALVAVLYLGEKAFFAARSSTMTPAERYNEDLDRLEQILRLEHPAPFRNANPEAFDEAVALARTAIQQHGAGQLSREGVLANFVRVVMSLRDPHTSFAARYEIFGILRMELALFEGEVRLLAAPDHEDVHARVLAFDGVTTAEVLKRIRPFVSSPTESGFRDQAPRVLRSPGLLHHAGVTGSPSKVALQIERISGEVVELVLPRVSYEDYRERLPVSGLLAEDELPRYRRTDRGDVWYELLPDNAGVYVRVARASSFVDLSLAQVLSDALAAAGEAREGPVIVDLRDNPGGNPYAHVALVQLLASSPQTRGSAALRVLVDRGTYSAAVVAASDLERRAGAMVVGEEPGDRAHLTTDARPFTLHHSGLEIRVPNGLMHSPGGAGGRSRLVPVRQVIPTFDDWETGRDPALESALRPLEAPDELTTSWLPTGRFAFDAHRTLTLETSASGYEATVTGLGSDLLSPGREGWSGGLHTGLRAGAGGRLERRSVDGEWSPLPPRPEPSVLELVYAGDTEAAFDAYRALTDDARARERIAELAITNEGIYRYVESNTKHGRILMDLAQELSPAHPLIPLQHALLRKDAERRSIPPLGELLRAFGACARRYDQTEVFNDLLLCL